jgi:hypothetical protein
MAGTGGPRWMKRLWWGWKRVVVGLNLGISRTLMFTAYWVGLGPVAIFFRLTHPDPTDRGLGDTSKSAWLPPRMGHQDVRRAQRPW